MIMRALLTGLFSVLSLGCAATPSRDLPADFAAQLDDLAPRLLEETLVPGAGVALIRGGAVSFVKGYGFADAERLVPVGRETGFNVGSISKTVAAWGVLALVEEGKLDLDTPVDRYLTRWRLPEGEFGRDGVTLRRLLSHTAGLSLHGYPGWGPTDPLPSLEASLSGATNGPGDVRLILQPGTGWRYSGGGYTLAQLVIEEVTGRPFASYLRERILRPLGMARTDYELTPEILAGSSRCFDSLGRETPNPRFTAQAAAGLHTTVEDLATFAAAALESSLGEPPGRGVLKPESLSLMLTPADASEGGYGLGYAIERLPGGRTSAGHGGANRGWQAYFQILPESGDGLVVTSNGSNGWVVHSQIYCAWLEWLTGEPPKDGCKRPAGLRVAKTLLQGGPEAARREFRQLKESGGDDHFWSEGQLNGLGYDLLRSNRVDDAIVLFELNVEAYPEAWNPFDSLGEGYMNRREWQLAIENYEKSLELNPENQNAVRMLERIRAEMKSQ